MHKIFNFNLNSKERGQHIFLHELRRAHILITDEFVVFVFSRSLTINKI